MLGERVETTVAEMMAYELILGNCKFTFPEAMSMAKLQDVSEVINIRGYVRAKHNHKNIVNINKKVRQMT